MSTVGEIEDAIRATARDLANMKARERTNAAADVFEIGPDSRREGSGPFTLRITDGVFNMMKTYGHESVLDEYRDIATESIQEAIVQHGQDFGAMIATFAARGENYFDAFN